MLGDDVILVQCPFNSVCRLINILTLNTWHLFLEVQFSSPKTSELKMIWTTLPRQTITVCLLACLRRIFASKDRHGMFFNAPIRLNPATNTPMQDCPPQIFISNPNCKISWWNFPWPESTHRHPFKALMYPTLTRMDRWQTGTMIVKLLTFMFVFVVHILSSFLLFDGVLVVYNVHHHC